MEKNINTNTSRYSHLNISEIAELIRKDWYTIPPTALPYLEIMGYIESIDNADGVSNPQGVVSQFLANATNWNGDRASAIKAELTRRLTVQKLSNGE